MAALERYFGRGPVEQAALPIDVSQAVKAQWIRVADVFVIGPLMVWGGVAAYKRSPVLGGLLALTGISTAIFNAVNWWTVNNALQQQVASSAVGRGITAGQQQPPELPKNTNVGSAIANLSNASLRR